jgi:hypothetical protein
VSHTKIKNALEQLLEGELAAADAVRMAEQAGYRTFADMCEAELPERLHQVRVDRNAVRRRIAQVIPGRVTLDDLRGWAEEVAAIIDRHDLGISVVERRRLSESLSLVAVASDTRIFRNPRPVMRVLASIVRSLGRKRSGNIPALYGALFHEQPEFHLLTRRLEDVEQGEVDPLEQGPPTYLPQTPSFLDSLGLGSLELDTGLDAMWTPEVAAHPGAGANGANGGEESLRCADVVALNRAYRPGSHVQDYEWVVAFSVATRSLVDEDTTPGNRVDGFVDRIRQLAPNFDTRKYRPEARRDQDGVLEVVLDAPTVSRRELVYASKLFGLYHRVGRVHFEGRRLATIAPDSES